VNLKGRFPRLYGCWCLLRGYPVAYRLRIENGGFVMDRTSGGGCYMECTVIGPDLHTDPAIGETRCPDGDCAAARQCAMTITGTA
jgi:hypothetical protein